ncbi:MAG: methyltransferase domain-containing protein [Candidatus Rokubacteria bacterium]|nr:methyltransferase domain-containing protein [Candidatus Rokubacteria bacterium]
MRSEHAGTKTGAFDSIAVGYDAWYDTPLGRLVDRLEKNAVLALVGDRAEGVALDLSCGTGNYALALAERSFRVVGVDVSEPMLRVARAKSAQANLDISWLRADASALPFRSGAFDLTTIVLGLEFTAEPGRVVGEAHRVLKPEGDLVVAILNRGGLWTLWRRLKRLVVPSVWRRATFFRPDELRDLLRARGFAAQGWRRAVHFLPLFARDRVGWVEWWEAIGARWMPASATFVAVAARRL